jgi:hypothetical protein
MLCPYKVKSKMPGFPTPTNVVGVNANRRDPHKPRESPALQRKEEHGRNSNRN